VPGQSDRLAAQRNQPDIPDDAGAITGAVQPD
jgi:hypothetical protein